MPKHNIYVPVTNTIMPRPQFRHYEKDDQEGKDFTYRNRDSVAPTHHTSTLSSTLKPHPFSPKLENDENEQSKYAHSIYELPHKKYKRIKRLSKNSRNIHKSV